LLVLEDDRVVDRSCSETFEVGSGAGLGFVGSCRTSALVPTRHDNIRYKKQLEAEISLIIAEPISIFHIFTRNLEYTVCPTGYISGKS
jgi:hypothetical protein